MRKRAVTLLQFSGSFSLINFYQVLFNIKLKFWIRVFYFLSKTVNINRTREKLCQLYYHYLCFKDMLCMLMSQSFSKLLHIITCMWKKSFTFHIIPEFPHSLIFIPLGRNYFCFGICITSGMLCFTGPKLVKIHLKCTLFLQEFRLSQCCWSP